MRPEDIADGHWIFAQEEDTQGECWAWYHVGRAGEILRKSVRHGSFGKAITDAIANGFRPQEKRWIVRSPHAEQMFPPNSAPSVYRPLFPADAPGILFDRHSLKDEEQRPPPGRVQRGEEE